MPRAKTVNKLPGKFVHYSNLSGRPYLFDNVALDPNTGTVIARLPRSKWTILPTGRGGSMDIDGCIGNYNRAALTVAPLLAALGFWSAEEAGKFIKWFNVRFSRQATTAQISSAKRTLEVAGYKVTKVKK